MPGPRAFSDGSWPTAHAAARNGPLAPAGTGPWSPGWVRKVPVCHLLCAEPLPGPPEPGARPDARTRWGEGAVPRDIGVSNERAQQQREGPAPRTRGQAREAGRAGTGVRPFRRAGGLRLVPPAGRRPAPPAPLAPLALRANGLPPGSSGGPRGAPCWLSLASRDALAATEFYARVLGWCHVRMLDSPVRPRFLALRAGAPVGTLSQATCDLGVGTGWIPYFAVDDVDATVGRLRERGATVAVGPLAGPAGRLAVAAGPQEAVFGLRQQTPDQRWTVGEGPVARLELHTPDIFAAALFYGGVLGWAGGSGESCEVEYAHGRIEVRDGLRTVAAIKDATPPGWHPCFRVADVGMAAVAAAGWGGRVISPPEGPPCRREAVLEDREGNPFTVIAS
ncbi:VOC family protein [Streptomyces sp. NPDC047197]|uniref:VOC family protein n=1 Tax=Streptomyces sp. NPDC047197 TaxID=3155477 RepID=UPI0033FB77C7